MFQWFNLCRISSNALMQEKVMAPTLSLFPFLVITLLPAVTWNKDKKSVSLRETQSDQSPIKQATLIYKSDLRSLPLAPQ